MTYVWNGNDVMMSEKRPKKHIQPFFQVISGLITVHVPGAQGSNMPGNHRFLLFGRIGI